ncbi:hypothetical protein BTO28_09775 [Domibacillus epiphyticus]|uniref:Uncharacterized protein n=1 Tax=Domibacillus epiphyticus TaxID=1714355 RepID=A0A1V2A7Q9_9BACI|nr:hypothetical protein BTO28_09775 [Domibacillus epiphyticus]
MFSNNRIRHFLRWLNLTVSMLRMMMMQMGMKPSQKKINQMMAQMNKQQDK